MQINVYPRSLLEQMWLEDKELFMPDAKDPPLCLRCGKPLSKRLVVNALSRHVNVYICKACGTDEALRDACDDRLPLEEWYALESGRKVELPQDEPALVTMCSFSSIFDGPKKKFPCSTLERPASELTYFRSDYDGYRWWTTWFCSGKERPAPELEKELDGFTEALFQLPEFRDLGTMRDFCHSSAKPTQDDTEFNLYSETEHFHIWLRLITRFKDYNLYCHFYQKEQAHIAEHE